MFNQTLFIFRVLHRLNSPVNYFYNIYYYVDISRREPSRWPLSANFETIKTVGAHSSGQKQKWRTGNAPCTLALETVARHSLTRGRSLCLWRHGKGCVNQFGGNIQNVIRIMNYHFMLILTKLYKRSKTFREDKFFKIGQNVNIPRSSVIIAVFVHFSWKSTCAGRCFWKLTEGKKQKFS
jgi:hypothetical protein